MVVRLSSRSGCGLRPQMRQAAACGKLSPWTLRRKTFFAYNGSDSESGHPLTHTKPHTVQTPSTGATLYPSPRNRHIGWHGHVGRLHWCAISVIGYTGWILIIGTHMLQWGHTSIQTSYKTRRITRLSNIILICCLPKRLANSSFPSRIALKIEKCSW